MRIPAMLLALALAGCASNDTAKVGDAVSAPLNDLNLVNAPIPELLRQAAQQPYALPESQACDRLAADVRALDEVLGPDLDAPATEANPGLMERGGTLATGALRNAAEGVVPFRGWVRKLSGAERYSRQVTAAIQAGAVRRGFLKGLARARGC